MDHAPRLGSSVGALLLLGALLSVLHYAFVHVLPHAAFYHKVERARVLASRRRRNVLAYVRAHPGATPAEISASLGIAYTTTRHHLEILERFSLLNQRVMGSNVRCFENHGRYPPAEASRLALAASEGNARVLSLLTRFPGRSQKELTIRLGLAKSTVSRRLKILEAGGLIVRSECGFTLTPEGAMALNSSGRDRWVPASPGPDEDRRTPDKSTRP